MIIDEKVKKNYYTHIIYHAVYEVWLLVTDRYPHALSREPMLNHR